MSLLSLLTSPTEIRAVFGVSEEELSDATLNLPVYDSMLSVTLSDIYEGLPALIQDIATRASASPSTATSLETQLLETVKVFSAYATSKTLLSNAKVFTPKRITDGRAEVERFADSFADLMDGLLSMYRALLARIRRLLRLLGIEIPEPVSAVLFGSAGLAVNPVTGE